MRWQCRTGGTFTGVGRYLKADSPTAKIILADPIVSRLAHCVNAALPDLDTAYKVECIGGSEPPAVIDPAVIDAAKRISDDESYTKAVRLISEGELLVGSSSGTAVVTALEAAVRESFDGPIVTLLADSWNRYYSQLLMRQPT